MANIKLKRKQKKDKSNKWLERHLNDYFFIQAKKKVCDQDPPLS